ncbi:hypothetical protein HanRHA438_Chr05g0241261 [Helianthus annuus]|nr:hypothetical protein HanRHA438_Chr05g0241261 [Helianthus annuus]
MISSLLGLQKNLVSERNLFRSGLSEPEQVRVHPQLLPQDLTRTLRYPPGHKLLARY